MSISAEATGPEMQKQQKRHVFRGPHREDLFFSSMRCPLYFARLVVLSLHEIHQSYRLRKSVSRAAILRRSRWHIFVQTLPAAAWPTRRELPRQERHGLKSGIGRVRTAHFRASGDRVMVHVSLHSLPVVARRSRTVAVDSTSRSWPDWTWWLCRLSSIRPFTARHGIENA
jgi:hypothetical protein